MWPYLVCFIITGIFAYIDEKSCLIKNKSVSFSGIIVILLPALLAGFRNSEVGTDTNYSVFVASQQLMGIDSLKSFIALIHSSSLFLRFDIGYSFLLLFLTKLFGNPQIILFILSFLTGLFVYLSLSKMRNECSQFIGEMVYLFTMYNASYNIIRQSLAMTIGLFSLAIVMNDEKYKYIKAIVLIGLAFLIHSSALICIIPIFVYLYYGRSKKHVMLKNIAFISVLLILITSASTIAVSLINKGLIDERYLHYFTEGNLAPTFSLIGIIIYFLPFAFFASGYIYMGEKRNFYIAISIVEAACFALTNISFYLYRVSAYIMIARIFSLSQRSLYYVPRNSKAKIPLQYGIFTGVVISLVLYFSYFTVYCNLNETIPYYIFQ